MNVLLCGASGFIGRRIAAQLEQNGHRVLRGSRKGDGAGGVAMDLRHLLAPEQWPPLLDGVDAVINAVGILREETPGDFERVHHRAPAALFAACAQRGIRRVVQISALGEAPTPYLQSKRAADQALLEQVPGGIVLRPGLVFGTEGPSTRLFLALASLPVHCHPGGAGPVQPVHVDDVAALAARLIESDAGAGQGVHVVEASGPQVLGYEDWMAAYRRLLDLPPAPVLPLPGALMSLAARVAGHWRRSLLNMDSWTMLRAGNTGDPTLAEGLLGRPLRPLAAFVAPEQREGLRLRALADWRRPLLLAVLATIWLVTALVSAFVFPQADSLALLQPFGLTGLPALLALYGASALDLAMGTATLWRPGRRLWWLQLALIAGYTVLIAWRLPAFLVHPFGPVLKNLAVAALLLLLLVEEKQP